MCSLLCLLYNGLQLNNYEQEKLQNLVHPLLSLSRKFTFIQDLENLETVPNHQNKVIMLQLGIVLRKTPPGYTVWKKEVGLKGGGGQSGLVDVYS